MKALEWLCCLSQEGVLPSGVLACVVGIVNYDSKKLKRSVIFTGC